MKITYITDLSFLAFYLALESFFLKKVYTFDYRCISGAHGFDAVSVSCEIGMNFCQVNF